MGPVDTGLPGRGGAKTADSAPQQSRAQLRALAALSRRQQWAGRFPRWAQSAGVLGLAHHEGCWDGAGAYGMALITIISNTFGVCLGIFRHHSVQKYRFTAES